MSAVKFRASTLPGAFEEAQTELVGKAVVLTDGEAGTVTTISVVPAVKHGARKACKG